MPALYLARPSRCDPARQRSRHGSKVMASKPAPSFPDPSEAIVNVPGRADAMRPPLCFVVDADASVRRFLSLILHGAGLHTEEFSSSAAIAAAATQRPPDIVFLDVALEFAEAAKCLAALATINYPSHVQLMSGRGSAVLAHVKTIGERHHLQMLPVVKKPIEPRAILNMLQELELGHGSPTAGRVDLDAALSQDWIEFWYQPKIDLRKKHLIGVESFARARHPQHGIMLPDAFMPGATEPSLVKLSEHALVCALKAGLGFAKLGAHLQLAVNLSANALVKMRLAEILQTYRPQFDKWPGLVIDVTEEQVVTDLARASHIARELKQLDVGLAIDNCGSRYSMLAKVKGLPFSEVKLDRALVADCATSKTSAPLCKTIINFGHDSGSIAVAIGIEKAADAVALLSMGCDYGQGFLLGQPMPEQLFCSLLRQRDIGARREPLPAERSVAMVDV
ncbi:MAG: EAL domain-containing response regulator [Xanthobacteraceae bacterium]